MICAFVALSSSLWCCSSVSSHTLTPHTLMSLPWLQVELPGLSFPGLNMVVDFLYSGEIQLDRDNIDYVLEAAHHLQVRIYYQDIGLNPHISINPNHSQFLQSNYFYSLCRFTTECLNNRYKTIV